MGTESPHAPGESTPRRQLPGASPLTPGSLCEFSLATVDGLPRRDYSPPRGWEPGVWKRSFVRPEARVMRVHLVVITSAHREAEGSGRGTVGVPRLGWAAMMRLLWPRRRLACDVAGARAARGDARPPGVRAHGSPVASVLGFPASPATANSGWPRCHAGRASRASCAACGRLVRHRHESRSLDDARL